MFSTSHLIVAVNHPSSKTGVHLVSPTALMEVLSHLREANIYLAGTTRRFYERNINTYAGLTVDGQVFLLRFRNKRRSAVGLLTPEAEQFRFWFSRQIELDSMKVIMPRGAKLPSTLRVVYNS